MYESAIKTTVCFLGNSYTFYEICVSKLHKVLNIIIKNPSVLDFCFETDICASKNIHLEASFTKY
jgi:hypothetical protein